MELSEPEKQQVIKILKRNNRHYWTDNIINKVIEILNQLRSGEIDKDSYFVAGTLSYEDYLYQIYLNEFL